MGTVAADPRLIFTAYGERLRRQKAGVTAQREYRIVTERFVQWLDEHGKRIEDVRRPDIEDFMSDSGWAPSTQRARLTWLRGPWNYAVEMEMLDKTPFAGNKIKLAKPPEREPKLIEIGTLRQMKAGIRDARENALFHVLAYTGFRLMEAFSLQWAEDIQFGAQAIHVIGKQDRERTIPMHPALQEALKQLGMFAGGSPYVFHGQNLMSPMGRSGADALIRRLWGQYGASAHDFRRTFATSLTDNGVERAVIAQLLGHAADDMAGMHYVKFHKSRLLAELVKIYQMEGGL